MQISGNIKKMQSSINEENSSVQYRLPIGGQALPMNELVGQNLAITFEGQINCINCGRKSNKSFAQGHCFPCMKKLASCDTCIVKPELCHFHMGTCREPDWGEENCFNDHYVYLSNTSGLKIGITRGNQLPTRWIDQGASYAIKVAETPYRQLAGEIEVALKSEFTDKTNWRRMLKNEIADYDLETEKWRLEDILPPSLGQYMTEDDEIIEINYPVLKFPEKVKSVGFDKWPVIEGQLLGIKGQYLLLDNDRVLNIRKHEGYHVELNV